MPHNHSLGLPWLSGAIGRLVEPTGELVGECNEPMSPGSSARTVTRRNDIGLRMGDMKQLPKTENSLVLRTDFSDETVWNAIRAAIQQPVGEFRAFVDFLDDRQYEGLTIDQLLALVSEQSNHTFVFVVDQLTFSHPEWPILVVDCYDEPGNNFRVVPSEMWGVENNLSIANMDFQEFADAVDADGVFRGFSGF